METLKDPKKTLFLGIIFLTFFSTVASPATACTIFTVSNEGVVLFGNNEDYYNRSDVIYFVPSAEGRYGVVYLGQRYEGRYNPQGGMNEKGLAFDANALPKSELNPHPERPQPRTWLAVMMMEECSTVEDVIEMAKSYDWGSTMAYQLHLADSSGDAVVIGPGPDGEIAFTRMGEEGYLVSTNFNLANPSDRTESCWRYETATRMLEEILSEDGPSLECCNSVLEAVAQKSAIVNTIYSNIFDTRNRVIYLYYFHQFGEVVSIDLIDELGKGFHYSVIGQLFSPETRKMARVEVKSYIEGQKESPLVLMGDVLLAIGFSFSVVLVTMFFWRARLGDHVERGGVARDSGLFDWVGFLRPDGVKVVVTLLLPAVVALLVTRSPDSVLDFYGYLLTPMMPYYDGTRITRVFNRYVLLWIPFYLAACVIAWILRRRK